MSRVRKWSVSMAVLSVVFVGLVVAPASAKFSGTKGDIDAVFPLANFPCDPVDPCGAPGLPSEQWYSSITTIAVDLDDNVYVGDIKMYSQGTRIRRIDAATNEVTHFAGNGDMNNTGDGGPAVNAGISDSYGGMVTDPSGNLYMTAGDRVRRIDANTGIIDTVVGGGATVPTTDGVSLTDAKIQPSEVAFAPDGTLVIGSYNDMQIYRVDFDADEIRVIAGDGDPGFNGDDIPAVDAAIGTVNGLDVASNGDIFFSSRSQVRVRRIAADSGLISTISGDGNLGYAGDGGPAADALWDEPGQLSIDGAGDLFISDRSAHYLRKIDAASGIVNAIAGAGVCGDAGTPGPAVDAEVCGIIASAFDNSGNLYLGDQLSSFRVIYGAGTGWTKQTTDGYRLTASDGGVFVFGDAEFLGSMGGTVLNRPVVDIMTTESTKGYWLIASDGGIFSFGDAAFHGSTGGITLNQPIVGGARTPTGEGYWLVASDGGVFSFGDAAFHGSTGGIVLNKPIVGMSATPSGAGYWLIASDGGVFAFGDAQFYGSTGAITLNQPIVGATSTPSGGGYWLVASDGGVFSFGDAAFHGSTGGIVLNKPIVSMFSTRTGEGYTLVATDGGVFTFGDAAFHGSTGGITLNQPIVAGSNAQR